MHLHWKNDKCTHLLRAPPVLRGGNVIMHLLRIQFCACFSIFNLTAGKLVWANLQKSILSPCRNLQWQLRVLFYLLKPWVALGPSRKTIYNKFYHRKKSELATIKDDKRLKCSNKRKRARCAIVIDRFMANQLEKQCLIEPNCEGGNFAQRLPSCYRLVDNEDFSLMIKQLHRGSLVAHYLPMTMRRMQTMTVSNCMHSLIN